MSFCNLHAALLAFLCSNVGQVAREGTGGLDAPSSAHPGKIKADSDVDGDSYVGCLSVCDMLSGAARGCPVFLSGAWGSYCMEERIRRGEACRWVCELGAVAGYRRTSGLSRVCVRHGSGSPGRKDIEQGRIREVAQWRYDTHS